MTPTGFSNYQEVALSLNEVAERFREIKARLGYSDRDARARALEDSRTIILSPVMITTILGRGERGQLDFNKLIGIIDGTPQTAANHLDNWARAALVTLYQFKVETMWKNLLRALGMVNPPQGYYKILQELFARVPVPDQAGKTDILQVLALIRNSLHSNGFHYGFRNSPSHIFVDGTLYRFDHGCRVECVAWWHIVKAINASATIIEDILCTPEISSLADPVPDDFPPVE